MNEIETPDHSPEPWRWAEALNGTGRVGADCDEDTGFDRRGGFVDAYGNVICWFGNKEAYDQTAGREPSVGDAERIIACVNFCREIPTRYLTGYRVKQIPDNMTDNMAIMAFVLKCGKIGVIQKELEP